MNLVKSVNLKKGKQNESDFCICISFLCFILPSKKLKEYCEKLGEKTFVIAESNENEKESIAVQILYLTKRRDFS